MRHHHPLGGACRSRGVLKECQRVGRGPRGRPRHRRDRLVGGGRGHCNDRQPSLRARNLGEGSGHFGGTEYHPCVGVAHDGAHPFGAPVLARGIGGDRHHTGVEATDEPADEIEPRREQQQDPISRFRLRRQRRGDGPRVSVELGKGAAVRGGFTVFEKREALLVGGAAHMPEQHVEQCLGGPRCGHAWPSRSNSSVITRSLSKAVVICRIERSLPTWKCTAAGSPSTTADVSSPLGMSRDTTPSACCR